jgi:hypothetical protein
VSGAAGIEVAQRGVAQAVDLVGPVQNALQDVLRFAVGAAGNDALAALDRHFRRIVEEVGSGAEDEAGHATIDGALDQVEPVDHIVAQVEKGLAHRLADQGVRGKVHHGVRPVLGHDALHQLAVG